MILFNFSRFLSKNIRTTRALRACQIFFALVSEFCLHSTQTSPKLEEVWVEFAHDVLRKKTSAAGEKIEGRLPISQKTLKKFRFLVLQMSNLVQF
jgi:hypothetical protein